MLPGTPTTTEDGQAGAGTGGWAPLVVGVGAVVVLCKMFPAPRMHTLAPRALPIIAACLMLDAIVVSVVAAMAVRFVALRRSRSLKGSVLRATWLTAIWVPAWVWSWNAPSLVTVVVGCFLMAVGSLALKGAMTSESASLPASSRADEREETVQGLLAYPYQVDAEMLPRVLLPSMGLAVLVEFAALAAISRAYGWASLFAGACVALVVWRANSKQSEHMSSSRTALAVMLAFCFTVLVLMPYTRSMPLANALEPLLRNIHMSRGAQQSPVAETNHDYTGIVLLSPNQERKKIVAPQKRETKEPSFVFGRFAKPMEIPFDGQYWYFKAPDKRPRPTARVVKGNSMKAAVRSTDWYPLLMEAHQKIDTPIALACCSRIDIMVQNADRRPGSIALELWVKSAQERTAGVRYYLGTAVIPSSANGVELKSDGLAALPEERLEFPVPSAMDGVSFDEIAVVVRSSPGMARMGAQIGIRRFVLEP